MFIFWHQCHAFLPFFLRLPICCCRPEPALGRPRIRIRPYCVLCIVCLCCAEQNKSFYQIHETGDYSQRLLDRKPSRGSCVTSMNKAAYGG